MTISNKDIITPELRSKAKGHEMARIKIYEQGYDVKQLDTFWIVQYVPEINPMPRSITARIRYPDTEKGMQDAFEEAKRLSLLYPGRVFCAMKSMAFFKADGKDDQLERLEEEIRVEGEKALNEVKASIEKREAEKQAKKDAYEKAKREKKEAYDKKKAKKEGKKSYENLVASKLPRNRDDANRPERRRVGEPIKKR